MAKRAFTASVVAGALLTISALAGASDGRLRSNPDNSRYLAPLVYEAIGTSGRACGYQARFEQMNLTVDRLLQCPSAVVCEPGRTSTRPICRSPIAPWKVR
jgi:hypothetical protein